MPKILHQILQIKIRIQHKSYAVSFRVVLQCEDSLQELAFKHRNKEFDWCGSLDTVDALSEVRSSTASVGPEP
jgi:hypothetical protein